MNLAASIYGINNVVSAPPTVTVYWNLLMGNLNFPGPADKMSFFFFTASRWKDSASGQHVDYDQRPDVFRLVGFLKYFHDFVGSLLIESLLLAGEQ